MSRPGDRLRALASHVFDDETMERLIDPVIADIQVEYAEASHAGLIWRRRWVRAVGYASLLDVATRTLRFFLALMLVLTALFLLPATARNVPVTTAQALYLIPHALVPAIPISLTLSIAARSRSVRLSPQSLRMLIASGVVCAAVSFVMLGWWIPSANQAFRVSTARQLGGRSSPARGLAEMTTGELREQMKWSASVHADWRVLEFSYHLRWALPCASLSLAFLMGALRRRGVTRRALLLSVMPIIFGYYVMMYVGRQYSLESAAWPAMAGVWMPNAITCLTAGAIATLGSRQREVA